MTEMYNYGFNVRYKFSRHVNELIENNLADFSEKGIIVTPSGTKTKRELMFTLDDVSAAEAVKRLLWTLTHLASLLNDFNGKSLDFLAMRLLTEGIRNLLLTTEGHGSKLKEWFKSDQTMRVVVFGDENSKLFIALDRTPKKPRVNY